jgi:ribosomal protein S21
MCFKAWRRMEKDGVCVEVRQQVFYAHGLSENLQRKRKKEMALRKKPDGQYKITPLVDIDFSWGNMRHPTWELTR